MNSNELNLRLFTNPVTRLYFGGTYAADKLPPPFMVPQSFVVNEDFSDEPGTHWVAIFIRSKNEVNYFDSLGRAPTMAIAEYLNMFPIINQNKKTYQSINSTVCGLYTMYFIYMSTLGYTLRQIETILSKQADPDLYVSNFVNKYV